MGIVLKARDETDEIADYAVLLMGCKWYQFKKKQRVRAHIKLIISTYSIEPPLYLTVD